LSQGVAKREMRPIIQLKLAQNYEETKKTVAFLLLINFIFWDKRKKFAVIKW
jgi:hypothetical protein